MNQNLAKFISLAKEINLKTFNFLISVLTNLVVVFTDKKNHIMQMSLRLMVGQAKRLMKEDKMHAHIVILNLSELILVLSDCFCNMDQILMT